MSSSTSNSEQRRARAFLGLFALLFVLAETGLATFVPEDVGRHEVDDCAFLVETHAPPIDLVFLSDSVSYGVLNDIDLPTDVLDLSSNQSIGMAGNAFLIQRLYDRLDAQAAPGPRSIVLAVNPVSFDVNLDSEHFLDPYFASVFHRGKEIADIESALGRPELVELMRRDAFSHTLQLPSHLRRGFAFRRLRHGLRALKRRLRTGSESGGGTPGGVDLLTPAARRKIEERSNLAFHVSEVTASYLPKLLELCAEHDTRLVIVTAPVPATLQRAWKESGYWDAYRMWLQSLAGENPNLSIVADCPYRPEDSLFYDGVHLKQAGKNAWARALERILLVELARDDP